MRSGDIVTPSMSSLTGIARNHAWPSTGSWSCVIGLISNPVNSPPAPSIYDWVPCAGSRMRQPIALLSADLAAGIRRVKGVKKLGVRLGNWLTAEQAHSLWHTTNEERLIGKRDRPMLSLLLACGLRRHEVVGLRVDDLQREEHWAIVD